MHRFILIFLCILGMQARAQEPLFKAGTDGYHSYRIPAIITTKKGVMLAFCEGRKDNAKDAGNIDILLKRSTDGGLTWSPQQVIWDDSANTCGNPCPVLDETTGAVWLLMTHNEGMEAESDIIRQQVRAGRTVWVCSSRDEGRSWSSPQNITASVKDTSWGWYATGPGIGIQLRYGPHKGRLVIPCDNSYRDPNGNATVHGYEYGAHAIYSDDHGATWRKGGMIQPKMNECQLVEQADGKGGLLMNMRSYFGRGCRAQAVSHDGGDSWSAPADAPQLEEPVCQAGFIRYAWPSKKRAGCLLFLNPASRTKRNNMTLKASTDDGQTWQTVQTLFPGPSAYSSMAVLPGGDLACLYEAGNNRPYETIIFQKIDRKILTNIISKK